MFVFAKFATFIIFFADIGAVLQTDRFETLIQVECTLNEIKKMTNSIHIETIQMALPFTLKKFEFFDHIAFLV